MLPTNPKKVLSISNELLKNTNKSHFEIHSIFSHTLNLVWEDTLYSVSSQASPSIHTIVIEEVDEFTNWVSEDSKVWLSDNVLRVSSAEFRIDKSSQLLIPPYNKQFQLDKRHSIVLDQLESIIKNERTVTVFSFDKNEIMLAASMQSILNFLEIPSQENALRILGLGPGLTPLGDDILLGYILGLNSVSTDSKFGITIIDNLHRTTRISQQMLTDVIQYNYSFMFREFVEDFFLHFRLTNVNQILKFGSTSGPGIMTGFLYAVRKEMEHAGI